MKRWVMLLGIAVVSGCASAPKTSVSLYVEAKLPHEVTEVKDGLARIEWKAEWCPPPAK